MASEAVNEDPADEQLSVVWSGDVVEVTDRVLDQWVVRLEPIDIAPEAKPVPTATLAVIQHLAMQFPLIAAALQRHEAYQVVFPAGIQTMLSRGSATLVQSGTRTLPIARGANGQFIANGTIVAGGAAVAAVPLWPVLLVAAVGAAAAWQQQQWTERAFDRVERSLDRIEYRLRDADHGALDAADAVVDLLAATRGAGDTPEQLRMELALARQSVESIYRSRHRFVVRFKEDLEAAQLEAERKSGKRTAWVGDAREAFAHGGTPVIEELLTYLRAMIGRARLGAWTASVLAADGDGIAALHLIAQIEDSIRADYWDLHNRLWALSLHEADSFWHRVPVLGDSKKDQADGARQLVTQLATEMRTKIGPVIPSRDAAIAVTVPSWQLNFSGHQPE
jgi:hypothetical protein